MDSAGERLSGVDRAWLRMDRATNPMVVVALVVFAERLSLRRLRERVAGRFLCHERFRCHPGADALGARWVPDAGFALARHVLRADLPPGATQADLEALVAQLASTPLDPARPLWTFHLVPRYGAGSAMVLRIHHCYADGVALVRVFLGLTDGDGGESVSDGPVSAGRPATAPSAPSGLLPRSGPPARHGLPPAHAAESAYEPFAELVAKLVHDGSAVVEKALHLALHPAEARRTARTAADLAIELGRLALLADDPPTVLTQAQAGRKKVAFGEPLPLADVRTVAKVLGSTVNDVALATLAGALGRYLRDEAGGGLAPGVVIRAAVPVNLRRDDADGPGLGNRFGLVFVELPVAPLDPVERVLAMRATMQGLKGSLQPLLVLGLLGTVGNLPAGVESAAIDLFSRKASLVVSNVPGPRQPLYFAGAPISRLLFWVPQSGRLGVGVSILTYDGALQVGVIADEALVAEPSRLVRYVAEEFERLVLTVLMNVAPLLEA